MGVCFLLHMQIPAQGMWDSPVVRGVLENPVIT